MNNSWQTQETTPEEVEWTRKVGRALADEINLLAREGAPVPCILAALGWTAADLITCQADASAVAAWFEQQASVVRHLQRESGKYN